MNKTIDKAAEKMSDTAEHMTKKVTHGVQGAVRAANAPLPTIPQIPQYAQHQARQADTDPETGDIILTHKEPFIRLTDESIPIEPGADRLNPYVMRGRHYEFQRLAHILEKLQPSPIHLITGPPGYGKSTMLETIKTYARQIGFITVEIQPGQFTDTNSLIEHIRGTVLGEQLAASHTQTNTGATTAGAVEAGVDAKFFHADVNLQHDRQHGQTHERKGNPLLRTNLEKIISQLNQHAEHVRGILLFCDEFQTITNTIKNNAVAYEQSRQNLYTLNEGFHKGGNTLPITTIVAGLPTAEDALNQMLTRPPSENTTELLPVDGYPVQDPDSTYCAQIIQDYIQAGQAADGHNLHIHPKDIYTWGAQCAGHVLYANQVGAIVQQQLRRWHGQSKTTVHPIDVVELNYTIKNKRRRYYETRIRAIGQNKPEEVAPQLSTDEQELAKNILHHLVVAFSDQQDINRQEKNPRFLTWESIQHIANHLHNDSNIVTKCLDKLQAIGAIRCMQFGSAFLSYNEKAATPDRPRTPTSMTPATDTTPHDPEVSPEPEIAADCTIPSLITHILAKFPSPATVVDQLRAENRKALESFPLYRTTCWPWTSNPDVPMLPKYPTFSYYAPITPAVLAPAVAERRATEIQNLIDQQQEQEAKTGTAPPWPDNMPQIPNNRDRDDPDNHNPQQQP